MSVASQDTTASSLSISRHPTLYFSDGDVALAADHREKKSGRHLFRVHRVILSLHSTVFAGMFTLPVAPTTNEEYDGVPLIYLVGDDAEAVTALLNYMYSPASLAFGKRDPDGPILHMKLLDIAAKYQVDSVRPLVVDRIIEDWPTTLFRWLQQQAEVSTAVKIYDVGEDIAPSDPFDSLFPEPAAAIRMALDHNIPSILPAAFYALAQIDFKNDWDRWRNSEWPFEQEDCDDDNPLLDTSVYFQERTARWSLIDKDSFYRLGLGKQALADREASLWRVFEVKVAEHCKIPKACKAELERLQECHSEISHKPDPLGKLRTWWLGKAGINLCWQCWETVECKMRDAIKELWEELPLIFHLDSLNSISH